MSEVTTQRCDDVDELVTRYAYGSRLSRKERERVEQHLKGCTSCGELILFVKGDDSRAKEAIRFDPPTDSCLTTDTLIALKINELDEEAARKAKLHLLACPPCRQVFPSSGA